MCFQTVPKIISNKHYINTFNVMYIIHCDARYIYISK